MKNIYILALVLVVRHFAGCGLWAQSLPYSVTEDEAELRIETAQLSAVIKKKGYVSGISAQTFLDKATGFRDLGHGLSIADFILEPGSDQEYRDRLEPALAYEVGNLYHGKRAKREVEGPQICTQARELRPIVTRGKDFVAVRMVHQFPKAAPGRSAGSRWTQTIVFPTGKRFYVCSQRIDSVNASPEMFFRIDMPGHIKHKGGDTFSEIYLSYLDQTNTPDAARRNTIPSNFFVQDYPPDEKLNYRRDQARKIPPRFIRAYHIRDPKSGKEGPWLAGMTLDPAVVYEAWCHQRGYVCMIEEFGGFPIRPGEHFSAAFLVGFFDSVEEMQQIYDRCSGYRELTVSPSGWKLVK